MLYIVRAQVIQHSVIYYADGSFLCDRLFAFMQVPPYLIHCQVCGADFYSDEVSDWILNLKKQRLTVSRCPLIDFVGTYIC